MVRHAIQGVLSVVEVIMRPLASCSSSSMPLICRSVSCQSKGQACDGTRSLSFDTAWLPAVEVCLLLPRQQQIRHQALYATYASRDQTA